MTASDDAATLRLERDLFLRLLELGDVDDLPPVLEGALALIVELTGATRGYLELRGRGGEPFSIAHGFTDAELGDVRQQLSTGILREAIATGRTLSTASAIEDPRFSSNASVQAGRIQAVLCAPIGKEPALGALYLQGRRAPGPFPEASRALAELFAKHLAPLADRAIAREVLAAAADHT
ncbi:MAG TPA: GAF domain-containing protein, partial [Minicystis sp.]|nr:GAF domain-containing protein [Minicystis sp.]